MTAIGDRRRGGEDALPSLMLAGRPCLLLWWCSGASGEQQTRLLPRAAACCCHTISTTHCYFHHIFLFRSPLQWCRQISTTRFLFLQILLQSAPLGLPHIVPEPHTIATHFPDSTTAFQKKISTLNNIAVNTKTLRPHSCSPHIVQCFHINFVLLLVSCFNR